MRPEEQTVLETHHLPRGLEIDVDEAWRKLIARQFGGSAGRGFSELIQNFLDSYPPETAWKDRLAKIDTTSRSITITDWGEGMGPERLELLVTLGGTDKSDDPRKLGTFGIGFFSVFNPALGTRCVAVTTRCAGCAVELRFEVTTPGERPRLESRVLAELPPFSTKVEVMFDRDGSSARCLEHARRSLRHYPCTVVVDGEPFESIWAKEGLGDVHAFDRDGLRGLLDPSPGARPRVTVLNKYEHVIDAPLEFIAAGGRAVHGDLRDFRRGAVPVVQNVRVTINSNELQLTIGRDAFFVDHAFRRLVDVLAEELADHLALHLEKALDLDDERDLIVANQYALASRLSRHIAAASDGDGGSRAAGARGAGRDGLVRLLADAKVHRIAGRRGYFSLRDLATLKSADLPVFLSPRERNTRWLAGQFRHDFVVVPHTRALARGAPDLHAHIFGEVFGHDSVVDLDEIDDHPEVITSLVERGVVDRDAVAPKTRVLSPLELRPAERAFADELDILLRHPTVLDAVRTNLHLPAQTISTAFFTVDGETLRATTGLFDDLGRLVDGAATPHEELGRLILGIRKDHPLIERLLVSEDPNRGHFALSFLAHELGRCQRLLAPQSRLFRTVAKRLFGDMRRGLLESLTSEDEESPVEGG